MSCVWRTHSDSQTVNASAAAVTAAAARRVLIAEKCFLILNQAKTVKWLLAIGLSHVHTHTHMHLWLPYLFLGWSARNEQKCGQAGDDNGAIEAKKRINLCTI